MSQARLHLRLLAGVVLTALAAPCSAGRAYAIPMGVPSHLAVSRSLQTPGGGGVFTASSQDSCTPVVPPPPAGPLPYLRQVIVGPAPQPGGIRCISAGDSIQVTFTGYFPDLCYWLRRIDLIPDLGAGPNAAPPILRLVVDDGGSRVHPCTGSGTGWSASIMFPALPAGAYTLQIQVALVNCSDSILPGYLFRDQLPLAVADSCTADRCLRTAWKRAEPRATCDIQTSPGDTIRVDLTLRTPVPLAEVHGDIDLSQVGSYTFAENSLRMHIQRIEPVGPAAGMAFAWTRDAAGVHWTIHTQGGDTFPATREGQDPPAALRVTLISDSNAMPEIVSLVSWIQDGSDRYGSPLGKCYVSGTDEHYLSICVSGPCDVNGDGVGDVRDLALMVRCMGGQPPCPDSLRPNSNRYPTSPFTLAGLAACAVSLLETSACLSCLGGSGQGTGSEPGVRISLGPLLATASGADFPLRISRAVDLGAARLGLSYPADEYEITGVDLPGEGQGWISAWGVYDGLVRLVLVNGQAIPKPRAVSSPDLEGVVHLTLKSGQASGGQVILQEGQFAGPGGLALTVGLDTTGQLPSGPPRLQIHTNRPNPFTTRTRFALDLEQASDLEVAIFDIVGRHVATVFRGKVNAGSRDFEWNGRREEGDAAPSGVYFLRVTSLGRLLTHKLILVRGG